MTAGDPHFTDDPDGFTVPQAGVSPLPRSLTGRFFSLTREDLVDALTEMERLAGEAVNADHSPAHAHDGMCHTIHAACLAESVLEVTERALMARATARVMELLDSFADRKGLV